MTNLLRTVRRKLIREENLKRYILYALGEVSLIIIGIVLALQLNSWNNDRIVKSESQKLLGQMIQDLNTDLSYFDIQKTEYEEWIDQIDVILNQVLDNDSIHITQFEQFAAGRMSMNFLKVNQITFSEMFNSGTTLKFDDDHIVRAIKEYYQFAEIALRKLNSDNEIFLQWSLETYGDEFNIIHRLFSGRNLDYIDWSWRKDPSTSEYKHLESINIYYRLALVANISVINQLQTKSGQLVELLNEEIG